MASVQKAQSVDSNVTAILDLLESYKISHPESQIDAYRYNSACIRLRIIDPDFENLDGAVRHDLIWELLEWLPEIIQSEISFLLLLTPKEVKNSLANQEFENPIPSNL